MADAQYRIFDLNVNRASGEVVNIPFPYVRVRSITPAASGLAFIRTSPSGTPGENLINEKVLCNADGSNLGDVYLVHPALGAGTELILMMSAHLRVGFG